MKRIAIVLIILMLPHIAIGSDKNVKFTVLQGEKAKIVAMQCSRQGPPEFEEIWIPDTKLVLKIESRLSEIGSLASNLCCLSGVKITDPEKYFRQYVGIVSNGRRLIYINAYIGPTPVRNWKTDAVMACDGGASFWGVVFDPEMDAFSQLAINGVA